MHITCWLGHFPPGFGGSMSGKNRGQEGSCEQAQARSRGTALYGQGSLPHMHSALCLWRPGLTQGSPYPREHSMSSTGKQAPGLSQWGTALSASSGCWNQSGSEQKKTETQYGMLISQKYWQWVSWSRQPLNEKVMSHPHSPWAGLLLWGSCSMPSLLKGLPWNHQDRSLLLAPSFHC